jgi:CRP/FNR family transcriptional regulator, cyclic AMP receptor protein
MRHNARLRERPSRQRAEGGSLAIGEWLDQSAGSPRTVRGLNQRLSQRLRETDDGIVKVANGSGRAHDSYWRDADNQTTDSSVNSPYLAAKNPWLQRQFCAPLGLADLPFIVGRRPAAWEGLPPWQPDLELNDTAPFRLSRNHFTIEKHDGGYRVRDLCSTLGTIVNGEPIGHYVRADASTGWRLLASDASLRAGENEVIAGGADSPFVFSVFVTSRSGNDMSGKCCYDLGRVDKNTDWQICNADKPQMILRTLMDCRLSTGRSQFQNPINDNNPRQQNRIVEANKLEGNRQSYWNNPGKSWGGCYLGLGSGIGIGTIIARLRAGTVAVRRLFIVLALSVLAGGCSLAVGRDVRAYDTCLSRHPHDTAVCEGPRQAYELEPSVVQLRPVASRPAAGYSY